MMNLSVITRDNSPHQGKPKIYISYYNYDRKEMAESIAAMFLKHRNCAIYYADDADLSQSTDKIIEVLKDMQAVVFPVYAKNLLLLSKAKPELDLCRKEHLPVIPILMDDTENAAFFEKYQDVFGNCQLLMPWVEDPSKLPFDKILENRLRNIITTDYESHDVYQREGIFQHKVEGRIRSAFRGSIFLSYRKSDRRLGRELINLIHSDPALSDVMIWFDEYLVLGEDYNDELKKRISECDIFMILGTEAALQEGNYILTHEYPEAREAEKPMILVCTDQSVEERCMQCFPLAKIMIAADQFSSTGSVLAGILKDKKGKMDEKPLEKSYLLGKAYLDGILTETNRTKGVRLVEQAANGGHMPAMRLMAHLYHEGFGVEKEPEKEFEWLAMAACAVEDAMGLTQRDFNELQELIALNWEQGDIRLKQLDFEGAFTCYSRMLEAARKIRKYDSSYLSFSTYETMALNRLANTRTYQKRYREARTYLGDALRIYKETDKTIARLGGDADYAETLMWLGNIERDEQNYTVALKYYQQSLDVADRNKKYLFTRRFYITRCETNESIGIIAQEQGNLRKAEEAFAEEFKLAQSFEKEFEDEQAVLFQMAALRRLGEVACMGRDLQMGAEYYSRSADCARKMNQLQKTHSSLWSLLDILFCTGKTYYEIKNYSSAKVFLAEMDGLILKSESSKASEKVTVLPNVSAEVCEMLGNIAYMENRPAHSRAFYKRMAAYCREAVDMERNDNNMIKLAAAYYKIITSNKYVNDPECTKAACELYKTLYNKYGDERLGNLYRKSIEIQQNHENNIPMHHRRVAGWTLDLFQRLGLLELHGIRVSDSISNSNRVTTEIIEMVIGLVEYESQITDRLINMMNNTLEMDLSVEEMRQTYHMMKFFGSITKETLSRKIPESIEFLVGLERISNAEMDYHEGLAFQIRIVMDVIGRWALEIMGSSTEKREQLIEYIDRIELFIEG